MPCVGFKRSLRTVYFMGKAANSMRRNHFRFAADSRHPGIPNMFLSMLSLASLASKGLPPFKRSFAPHRIGGSSHHNQGHLPKRIRRELFSNLIIMQLLLSFRCYGGNPKILMVLTPPEAPEPEGIYMYDGATPRLH